MIGVSFFKSSNGLKEDFREAPIDVNYKNAEIVADNIHYLGVGVLKAGEDQPFSFSVGGIHKGVITVSSKQCSYYNSKYYSESGLVEFEVPANSATRCLFSIFVMPEFTSKEANKIQWRGLTGTLLVRKSDNVILNAEQLEEKEIFYYSFLIKPNSRVYLQGCGFKIDQKVKGDYFELSKDQYIDANFKLCVIDGFIKSPDGEVKDVSLLWNRYTDISAKLSEPQISKHDSVVKITSESSLSIISFEEKFVFKSEAEFKNGTGTVRFYSSKGRFGFCDLIKGSGYRCYQ